jgi:hypothetical protein
MPIVFYIHKRPLPGSIQVPGGCCAVDADSNICYNRMKHPFWVSGSTFLRVMELPDQQIILGEKAESANKRIHDCNHPAAACAACEYYQICDVPHKNQDHVLRPTSPEIQAQEQQIAKDKGLI